jgi:hypothetical protein
MNLIETMLSAANGGVGHQLASQFGLDTTQVGSVVTSLAPTLAGALKEKLSSGNAAGLLDTLNQGNLQKYVDDPASLGSPGAAQAGQNILGQLFGGGNALSSTASAVGEKTGVGAGVIQNMLPLVAPLLMGFIAKHVTGKDGQVETDKLNSVLGSLTGEHHGVFDALKAAAGKVFG